MEEAKSTGWVGREDPGTVGERKYLKVYFVKNTVFKVFLED